MALELESLFYKESVAEEHIEIVNGLERRWQAIAELIGFDFTNEDAVATIEKFFPVIAPSPFGWTTFSKRLV